MTIYTVDPVTALVLASMPGPVTSCGDGAATTVIDGIKARAGSTIAMSLNANMDSSINGTIGTWSS